MTNLAVGRDLYIRSMGKALRVSAIFKSRTEACKWTSSRNRCGETHVTVANMRGVEFFADAHSHHMPDLPASPVQTTCPENYLSGHTLYLSSMGLFVRLTGLFVNDDDANEWIAAEMVEGRRQGVILNTPPLVFCADIDATELSTRQRRSRT